MEKLKGKSKYIFIGIIIILAAIITVLIINKKSDRFETISTTKENVGTVSKNENKSNSEAKEITTDDKVTIDNYCEFNINKSIIAKNVNPVNPDSYYQYLNSGDGKILVGLELKIKSLKSEAVKQNSMISGKLIYDNKYEYNCSVAVEEADGGNINTYTNLYNIEPLETLKYFLISEVSEEITNSGKPIKAIINVNGNSYSFNIK